jgi:hypothetical protein
MEWWKLRGVHSDNALSLLRGEEECTGNEFCQMTDCYFWFWGGIDNDGYGSAERMSIRNLPFYLVRNVLIEDSLLSKNSPSLLPHESLTLFLKWSLWCEVETMTMSIPSLLECFDAKFIFLTVLERMGKFWKTILLCVLCFIQWIRMFCLNIASLTTTRLVHLIFQLMSISARAQLI